MDPTFCGVHLIFSSKEAIILGVVLHSRPHWYKLYSLGFCRPSFWISTNLVRWLGLAGFQQKWISSKVWLHNPGTSWKMVSNQCSILPRYQPISHTSCLACSILSFSGSPANTAIPPPFICWAASCGQLLSMRRVSVWEVLDSAGIAWCSGVACGNTFLLEKPWQEYSFFFVVLTMIVCTHVFLTAGNEIVSKIKSGKVVNGQVNSCRAKIFIFTVADIAEEVAVWSQKQPC